MVIKNLVNWKNLTDEEKKDIKKKLVVGGLVVAGFGLGVVTCETVKTLEKKLYPDRYITPVVKDSKKTGLSVAAGYKFDRRTKSGKINPRSVDYFWFEGSADDAAKAIAGDAKWISENIVREVVENGSEH